MTVPPTARLLDKFWAEVGSKAKAVVVDVRLNEGGYDSFGLQIAERFVPRSKVHSPVGANSAAAPILLLHPASNAACVTKVERVPANYNHVPAAPGRGARGELPGLRPVQPAGGRNAQTVLPAAAGRRRPDVAGAGPPQHGLSSKI